MRSEPRPQTGLSVHTLLIAGAASAAAAFVIPLFWKPGTVFAAAMTPIIVAVVTEGLKRPTETVKSVAAARRTASWENEREDFDPLAPPPPEDLEALPQTTSQRTVRSSRGFKLTPRQWKVALATGALAFVLAVTFVTASELIAGEKVGGSSNPTTFFGERDRGRNGGGNGSDDDKEKEKATPEATRTPGATSTPTPTATPVPTQTPAPTATATPTPLAEPAPAAEPPAASPTPVP